MSLPDSSAFHRGREARANDRPCIISDGRMSDQSRQDWFAGWNHEDNARKPKPTDEEIAQNDGYFAKLRAATKLRADIEEAERGVARIEGSGMPLPERIVCELDGVKRNIQRMRIELAGMEEAA